MNKPPNKRLIINKEKSSIQKRIKMFFDNIKNIAEYKTNDIQSNLITIYELRTKIYEELNQLQHAYLIILAAEELKKEHKEINIWFWHPEQTSSLGYTDLTGFCNDKVILRAEVTTSAKPQGSIDTRMYNVLEKLNDYPGLKYYYVVTKEMKQRAEIKKRKHNYNVEIRLIGKLKRNIVSKY